MFITAIILALITALCIVCEIKYAKGIFGALGLMACIGLGGILFLLQMPLVAVGQFGLSFGLIAIVSRYLVKSRRRKKRQAIPEDS